MRKRFLGAALLIIIPTALILARRALGEKAQGPSSTIETQSNGSIRLNITNTATVPITALAAVGTRTFVANGRTGRSVRLFDSVLNPFSRKEILPGQTYSFSFFGPNPPENQLKRDVEFKAAIFADGSTWGDPEWVNTLLLRRSSAYRYNAEALQLLEHAPATVSAQALTQQLAQLEQSELTAAKTVAEKQMVEVAFEEPIAVLANSMRSEKSSAPVREPLAQARSQLYLRNTRLMASKPVVGN